MSQGQGSFQTNQRVPPVVIPPPGPPFTLTSANNGTSVDPVTGRIVLGQAFGAVGNPAIFLSDRQIPMALFSFKMDSFGFRKILIDNAANLYQFGDIDGSGDGMTLSFYGGKYSDWGDTNSVGNNTIISLDDGVRQVAASSGPARILDLNVTTNRYDIGRITGGNNTKLRIDDAVSEFDFRNTTLNAKLRINNVIGFTGTITPVTTITVDGGIVTNVA
jgi:hypothetical protein